MRHSHYQLRLCPVITYLVGKSLAALNHPGLEIFRAFRAANPTIMLWLQFTNLIHLGISWREPQIRSFYGFSTWESVEGGETVQVAAVHTNPPLALEMIHLENGNIFVCWPQSPCLKNACSKAAFPLGGFSEECMQVVASFLFQNSRAIRQSSGKPLIKFPRQRVRAVSPHNNVETEILQSKGL